jgi:hypothetical protein
MPAPKRPTAEDAASARRMLLDGLAGDQDIFEVMTGLAPLHPRYDTFPGEVFLHLAADALGWSGARQADPVALDGLRERFLPECSFRGLIGADLDVDSRGTCPGPGKQCWPRPGRIFAP